jgi:hypothetical protein
MDIFKIVGRARHIPGISLKLAKPDQMPYPTAGDWHWEEDGSLLVRSVI